jgi:uncharacterized zinc-type alcohol dehydrogenase-like protein
MIQFFNLKFVHNQLKKIIMPSIKAFGGESATTPLVPLTIERRSPKPHDVEMEIKFCGVCHSDLHTVRNEWGNAVYPCVPGHEIVGIVTAIGSDVKKFKVGDKAAVGCLVDSCRDCDNCKEGLEQYCVNGATFSYGSPERDGSGITHGGYSQSIVTHEDFVLHIPDNLPLDGAAPLLCAGITTYSPLRHWKVGKGTRVGILGLGGLGHMGVKIAAAMGAEVTMLSHTASKEKDAKRLGAHQFILTSDAEQTKKVTGYFDFILDTVSAEHDYNFYLGLGVPPSPAQIPALNLIFGRKSFAGSLIGGLPETQEMLNFCAEHNIVSDIELIRMDQINEAYDRLLKSDVKYRFVIDMATI